MLRLAICDDLAGERETLRRFLEGYFAQSGHAYEITEYVCGEPLAADYEDGDGCFDLIFLDIFMGGLNGVETAKRIRAYSENVPIVFLTTSPDFALESYDVQAMGYLLKPLQPEKAAALLGRFLREEYAEQQKTLLVREGGRGGRIAYREILFVESQRNVLIVHTKSRLHRIYRTMAELDAELCEHAFLRCHQSYLVNLAQVDAAEKTEFIMTDGTSVPIRQRDAKAIRDTYFAYLLGQTPLGNG